MVISLSSDETVWNAVMNNEVVQEVRESFYAGLVLQKLCIGHLNEKIFYLTALVSVQAKTIFFYLCFHFFFFFGLIVEANGSHFLQTEK